MVKLLSCVCFLCVTLLSIIVKPKFVYANNGF